MLTINDTLIPSRFLSTVSHFIATIMAVLVRSDVIFASIPLGSLSNSLAYSQAESSFIVAASMTFLCFAIEFYSIFNGLTIFSKSVNLLQICAHVTATIFLSMFMVGVYNYVTFWYLWTLCR
jgi:Transmembrane protein